MIPVSAIADDKVLDVKADDGQVHTEEHGGENYDRVNVKASNNSTANVNVGEVSNAGIVMKNPGVIRQHLWLATP